MKENKENATPAINITNLDHIKPCWYWDKKDLAHTPSQSEGLDPATEARYRREGARFIFDVGTRLGLYPFTLTLVYTQLGVKVALYASRGGRKAEFQLSVRTKNESNQHIYAYPT